jgi:hypothetical protein
VPPDGDELDAVEVVDEVVEIVIMFDWFVGLVKPAR